MSRFLFDEVSLDEIYLGDNKTTCDDLNPARSCLGTLRLRLRAKKRRGHASQSKLANSVSRKKNIVILALFLNRRRNISPSNTHPPMPALVMMLKYVKLVTGDLSARVPSLPIRKPLQDSFYCWPVSIKFPWLAFK